MEGEGSGECLVLEIELKLYKKLATISVAENAEMIENVLMLHGSGDTLKEQRN